VHHVVEDGHVVGMEIPQIFIEPEDALTPVRYDNGHVRGNRPQSFR
jgi:hypothetical protein